MPWDWECDLSRSRSRDWGMSVGEAPHTVQRIVPGRAVRAPFRARWHSHCAFDMETQGTTKGSTRFTNRNHNALEPPGAGVLPVVGAEMEKHLERGPRGHEA